MTDFLIPVDPDNPYPLGRAGVHHDPQNKRWRALVEPPPRIVKPYPFGWLTRDVLQQWDDPRCTVESAVGQCLTYPHTKSFKEFKPLYMDPDFRHATYLEAKQYDPWEGEDYEGSSSDAPLRVLRNRGVIRSWKWLFGEEELREWLQYYGPAGVGTMWTTDMFYPDSKGYIHPTGGDAGGHAYRIVQYSVKRNAYRIINSWGREWGINGRAWITAEDMAALLANFGEAVTIGV